MRGRNDGTGQQSVPENNAAGTENNPHTLLKFFRICKAFTIAGLSGFEQGGGWR